jgi:hypothetical protein
VQRVAVPTRVAAAVIPAYCTCSCQYSKLATSLATLAKRSLQGNQLKPEPNTEGSECTRCHAFTAAAMVRNFKWWKTNTTENAQCVGRVYWYKLCTWNARGAHVPEWVEHRDS